MIDHNHNFDFFVCICSSIFIHNINIEVYDFHLQENPLVLQNQNHILPQYQLSNDLQFQNNKLYSMVNYEHL